MLCLSVVQTWVHFCQTCTRSQTWTERTCTWNWTCYLWLGHGLGTFIVQVLLQVQAFVFHRVCSVYDSSVLWEINTNKCKVLADHWRWRQTDRQTPWTIKNVPLSFFIITLAFLGRFLYFLYQWKEEGILYKRVDKIYHFTLTVSPHYPVKLKPRINSTF